MYISTLINYFLLSQIILAIPRRNDPHAWSMDRQQLGSHPVDAETNSRQFIGSIRTVEVQNPGEFIFKIQFVIVKNCDIKWKFFKIPPEDKACNIARACKLQSRALKGDRYLHTCSECPQVYPWIKNEFGLDI